MAGKSRKSRIPIRQLGGCVAEDEPAPVAGQAGRTPFERIRRTNAAGADCWSSRDFAEVLGYGDYRNFEQVVAKARMACFNSAQRIEDHFVDITEMIEIGKGGQRAIKTTLLSRYACYLIVQNADPAKEIVALGQTYFAVQTHSGDSGAVEKPLLLTS